MEKISINLLPLEVAQFQRSQSKFAKIQAVSIVIVLTVILLATSTFALGILQETTVKNTQVSVQAAEEKISKFKDIEGSLLILKNRVSLVSQIAASPSKQRTIFNLVTNLLPPSATVNSLEVDKSGALVATILAQDINTLDQFLTNLVTPEKTEGGSYQVDIESFARGRDGIYRANIKIVPK